MPVSRRSIVPGAPAQHFADDFREQLDFLPVDSLLETLGIVVLSDRDPGLPDDLAGVNSRVDQVNRTARFRFSRLDRLTGGISPRKFR